MAKQMLTIVNIDEEKLFNGARVKHKESGKILTIKSLPNGKTLSEAIGSGKFDPYKNITWETVHNNPSRFELLEDDDDSSHILIATDLDDDMS